MERGRERERERERERRERETCYAIGFEDRNGATSEGEQAASRR
jgi:hypothetical protein